MSFAHFTKREISPHTAVLGFLSTDSRHKNVSSTMTSKKANECNHWLDHIQIDMVVL